MSDTTIKNRKPTHDVCHIRGEGDNAHWTPIGAAWMHKDQGGLSVVLDYMPVHSDGRLVIRVRKDKSVEGK